MSNSAKLFENLLMLNDINEIKKNIKPTIKKSLKEAEIPGEVQETDIEQDATILNLAVELPTDKDIKDISPDEVSVNVGVMPMDTSDADPVDDEILDDESSDNSELDYDNPEAEAIEDEAEVIDAEESLKRVQEAKARLKEKIIKKESVIKVRMPKKLKEASIILDYSYDADVETIDDCIAEAKELAPTLDFEYVDEAPNGWPMIKVTGDKKDIEKYLYIYTGEDKDDVEFFMSELEENLTALDGKDEGDNSKEVGVGPELVKGDKNAPKIAKEALLNLDTRSLNKLVTAFVKDNYKNIDKVVFNKAMLENRKLTLEASINFINGKTEKFVIENNGFDSKKLENKIFEIDFKEVTNSFKIMKEEKASPFVFKAKVTEGILSFDTIKANYKVQLKEGKIAEVTGKFGLKESVKK